MTCTAHGVAGVGPYVNVGTASATSTCGQAVVDVDASHYTNETHDVCTASVHPSLALRKATNGHDADDAPGPEIAPGSAVTWTYEVTNDGNVDLAGVVVSDDDPALTVSCPATTLAAGAAMTCTAAGVATEGQYANLGTARGESECGDPVATDPSHYHGTSEPPGDGEQGCTPGYWKNHTDSWPPTGYAPQQAVQSVFAPAAVYPAIGSASLLDALAFHGGSGVEGGARNLLRAAVAALLNGSHPGVDHPRSAASVIADVDGALASGDRDAMLALASALDADNNLGCPLS